MRKLLSAETWTRFTSAHAERADAMTEAHRARRAIGKPHAIEDFLYTYYPTRPASLRRWHPGAGVGLEPGSAGPAPHTDWRWYSTDTEGIVSLDVDRFRTERGEAVRFVHRLLASTSSRPPHLGCFGLHEWAMVYQQRKHRHPLPLRLGQAGTDEVVDSHPVRCSHFDAFRFFTPEAEPLNRLQPTRAGQADLEQPGCLHAAMDCHKWAMKLGPAVPGDLALDCFELAQEVRLLDMQASPYDLSSYALPPVPIETAQGRAEYVARQRMIAERSAGLRTRLMDSCAAFIAGAPA